MSDPRPPAGDQPQAIEKLVAGLEAGRKHQVLRGLTGSGKTYVMGKVTERAQRYELDKAGDAVVEMVRRPNAAWLDPAIEIVPQGEPDGSFGRRDPAVDFSGRGRVREYEDETGRGTGCGQLRSHL